MDATAWAVDWNPDFEDDMAIRRQVLEALNTEGVMRTVRRLAQQSMVEALEEGLETEHLVWLENTGDAALFVRVWFEASEEKVFIIVEENDLGDIGFLLIEDFDCATYGARSVLKVEFRDPETMGVSR